MLILTSNYRTYFTSSDINLYEMGMIINEVCTRDRCSKIQSLILLGKSKKEERISYNPHEGRGVGPEA